MPAPPDFRRLTAALERFGLDLGDVPNDTDPATFAALVDVAARNWRVGRIVARRQLWRRFRINIPLRMSVRASSVRGRIRL